MQAYKFETIVLKNGVIQLPEISKFVNCRADVLITIKQSDKRSNATEAQTIDRFLDKWTGFLKGGEPDDSKRQYLVEKYQ